KTWRGKLEDAARGRRTAPDLVAEAHRQIEAHAGDLARPARSAPAAKIRPLYNDWQASISQLAAGEQPLTKNEKDLESARLNQQAQQHAFEKSAQAFQDAASKRDALETLVLEKVIPLDQELAQHRERLVEQQNQLAETSQQVQTAAGQ